MSKRKLFSSNLGDNLRNIRHKKNISLKQIADHAGVTVSFLSQVENGKTSPSLSVLKEIANYLNIAIGSILGESVQADNPVTQSKERKKISYANGINMYLLTSPDANKQMEPLLMEMQESANSGPKSYQHFGQEFVMVLQGLLEIKLNNESYILKKGDSIYFNSSIPHSFRNLKKGVTEAIWVVTPPTF